MEKLKIKDLVEGMRVEDNWYGLGTVKKIYATRVDVEMDDPKLGKVRYDEAHIKEFLTKAG